MAVIRSMVAEVPNHEPSLMLMNCGDAVQSRPSVGFVGYAYAKLGTENQNLPGFIAMCPGGYPVKETDNWQSGFLPGTYQGTYIDSQFTKLEKLIENIRSSQTSLKEQRQQLDLLQQMNEEHQMRRKQDARLEASGFNRSSWLIACRWMLLMRSIFQRSRSRFAICTERACMGGRL